MKEKVLWYKNPYLWGFVAILVLVVIFSGRGSGNAEYDSFAACMTDAGAVMYGTDWCPHCKNQKELFGDSFQNINYVNCDINREECLINGVQGYPTWKIGGKSYSGTRSLEELALYSGCELVKDE